MSLPTQPDAGMIQDPQAILDRMTTIVEAEMLVRGRYITEVVNPERHDEGAICEGRHMCAIGTLWIAAGAQVVAGAVVPRLPETGRNRYEYARKQGALGEVLEMLEEIAQQFADNAGIQGIHLDTMTMQQGNGEEEEFDCAGIGPLERLFEAFRYDHGEGVEEALLSHQEFLEMIAEAKRRFTNGEDDTVGPLRSRA